MTVLTSSSQDESLIQKQIQATRLTASFMPLLCWAWVQVSGPDAATFLQAQTTNDVLALEVGQGHLNALLDRTAAIKALFNVFRVDKSTYWLGLHQAMQATVMDTLETAHFLEEVTFEPLPEAPQVLLIQGPQLTQVLAELVDTNVLSQWAKGLAVVTPNLALLPQSFSGEAGALLVLSQGQVSDMTAKLSSLDILQLGEQAFEVLRIEAGQLWYGKDYDQQTQLTITGLQQQVVSYTKGCFPGQEVVAKVKTYGSAPKSLVGLVFGSNSSIPEPQSTLQLDGTTIGEITSSCFSPTMEAPIALAYVKRDYRVPDKTLSLNINGVSCPATVKFLPFYQPLNQSEQAKTNYEAGLEAFAKDNEPEAERLLRQAISLDPLLSEAYESLGVLLGRHHQYDEAIRLMHELAELQPDSVMAHSNLSLYYMKKGMIEEAEAEKAKATVLQFQQQVQASMKAKQDEERARQEVQERERKRAMFEEVLEIDPDDLIAGYGLAQIYLAEGAYQKAIDRLRHVLSVDENHSVSYAALGKALEEAGQKGEAKTIYEKGVEVASRRGDMMPMQECQQRLAALG